MSIKKENVLRKEDIAAMAKSFKSPSQQLQNIANAKFPSVLLTPINFKKETGEF